MQTKHRDANRAQFRIWRE